MEFTKEQIAEARNKASGTIRSVLDSVDTFESLQDIRMAFVLNTEQFEEIKKIVGLILLGLIPISELEKSLSVKIPPEKIAPLKIKLNEIFEPVKNILSQLVAPVMEAIPQQTTPSNETIEEKLLESGNMSQMPERELSSGETAEETAGESSSMSIIDNKMNKVVKLPTEISRTSDKPQANVIPPQYKVDPYRESLQ